MLLASRAEDTAADDEYRAYLRYTGLAAAQLHRIRMEAAPLPPLELSDYSGVIVGGSPFTSSDPEDQKTAAQQRVERELSALLDRIVAWLVAKNRILVMTLGTAFGLWFLVKALQGLGVTG